MVDVREYARLSKDRGGTSIARQRKMNRAVQMEHGWSAGEAYSDNDRSASPYRRRERENFERLLSDLETGEFGAKILQAYETSRLTRETEDTVRLIKVCRNANVKIYITQHERLYNCANARDRKDLKDSANDDEYSSDQTSKRVGDTAPIEAEKGRPYGRAPYGYIPVYHERTGKLITWVADENTLAGYVLTDSRAHVIRELFRRIEKGHSLRRIAQHFSMCGYLNKSGQPFSKQHLRSMAICHAYAGIRHYKGNDYNGIWDGLVSVNTFHVVLRILSDPSRRTTRNGRAIHEFTGVIRCERCDGLTRVRNTSSTGTPVYQCLNHHVSMVKEAVDKILTKRLIEYLSDENVYNMLTARFGNDADVAEVRTALTKAHADKQELEKETPKTLALARVLARSIDALEKDIAALEERERELTLPPALASILGAREGIGKAWMKAPVEACREIVRHVMVPDLMGTPTITSVSVGQWSKPAGERLQWDVH